MLIKEVKRDLENLKQGRIMLAQEAELEKRKELRLEYQSEEDEDVQSTLQKTTDLEDDLDLIELCKSHEKKSFNNDNEIQLSQRKSPDLVMEDETLNLESFLDITATESNTNDLDKLPSESHLNTEFSNRKETNTNLTSVI